MRSHSASHGSSHKSAEILTDIYRDDANIAIWQRQLTDSLTQAAAHIIDAKPNLKTAMTVTPQDAFTAIQSALGATKEATVLSEDITQLVDMFCCLFDLRRVGLRLAVLDRAMCPRFHVDKVPCRLVTTYRGSATQWFINHRVDRSKLGHANPSHTNQSQPDEQSGLFNNTTDIQQLNQGDVALLKGELWEGNEGAGLIHRSPQVPGEAKRLLLTLDFSD